MISECLAEKSRWHDVGIQLRHQHTKNVSIRDVELESLEGDSIAWW